MNTSQNNPHDTGARLLAQIVGPPDPRPGWGGGVLPPDPDPRGELRRIYADWLDESGEPERAEFIRVQVELARLENADVVPLVPSAGNLAAILGATLDMKRDALRRRERELFCWRNINAWFGYAHWERTTTNPAEFNQLCSEGIRAILVNHGFPARVTCRSTDWWGEPGRPGHGPEIVRACPLERDGVAFADLLPDRTTLESSGEVVYCWWRSGYGPKHAQLPTYFFEQLIKRHRAFVVPLNRITCDDFPTPKDATSVLSTAALAWARLPPCGECSGRGMSNPTGFHSGWDTCRPCHGLGRVLPACRVCRGSGFRYVTVHERPSEIVFKMARPGEPIGKPEMNIRRETCPHCQGRGT